MATRPASAALAGSLQRPSAPRPASTHARRRGRAAASWALQIVVAAILVQTLFFKFTAAPESVAIFSQLGAEPWGRVASGLAELVAATLLLVPAAVVPGAALALGVIGGAILSHLTVLGIAVANSDGSSDGGLLFALALVVAIGSGAVLALRRRELVAIARAVLDRLR